MKAKLRAIGALLLTAAFAGCSTADRETRALSELSASCLINSDCTAPLVCAFQRCHVECLTTRDCDGAERCVGVKERDHVCQLAAESTCRTMVDCPLQLSCGLDGQCRDTCAVDAECLSGQVCVSGVCAEPRELDDSGKLPSVTAFQSCRLNSDCESGLRCTSGNCMPECRTDEDCVAGKVCLNGACAFASDAGVCPNAVCDGGGCDCQCRATIDCAAGEFCEAGRCQPNPAPECSSTVPCASGRRCIEGSCACACVNDRDCDAGASCDGCSCVVLQAPTRIHDAQIQSQLDIAKLKGITEVESSLSLGGGLATTEGLEDIESVGSLMIASSSSSLTSLAGLRGLKRVAGNVVINGTNLERIDLPAGLRVGGELQITYNVALSVCAIEDFRSKTQTLNGDSFPESALVSLTNLPCATTCEGASCPSP